MLNEHKNNLPSLTQVTQHLRSHKIVLRWDVTLAGLILISNKNLPPDLHLTIWRYSRELLICCILADVRLCRNPDKHRQYWYHLSRQFYSCPKCFERGLDNNMPLHQARDVLVVMRKEEEELVG
jgi:hypothetical protein